MRKNRLPAASSYSERLQNQNKTTTATHQSGTVNRFRNLDDIPDIIGDDLDYGFDSLESRESRVVSDPTRSPRIVVSSTSRMESKSSAVGHSSHGHRYPTHETRTGQDGSQEYDGVDVDWDALSDDVLAMNLEESQHSEDNSSHHSALVPSPEKLLVPTRNQDTSFEFSRKPRDVEFKPYTLEQYRLLKPKEYIEYPKSHPDLNTEELKAKRANRERIKDFAKNLDVYNRKAIEHTRLVQVSNDCVDGAHNNAKAGAVKETARDRALQFARNVPRPVPKKQEEVVTKEALDKLRAEREIRTARDSIVTNEEQRRHSRLYELEAKHSHDRQQVDRIKRTLGL